MKREKKHSKSKEQARKEYTSERNSESQKEEQNKFKSKSEFNAQTFHSCTIIHEKDIAWHDILHQIYVYLKQEYKVKRVSDSTRISKKPFGRKKTIEVVQSLQGISNPDSSGIQV